MLFLILMVHAPQKRSVMATSKHKRLVAIETGKLWFEAERRTTNSDTFCSRVVFFIHFKRCCHFNEQLIKLYLNVMLWKSYVY